MKKITCKSYRSGKCLKGICDGKCHKASVAECPEKSAFLIYAKRKECLNCVHARVRMNEELNLKSFCARGSSPVICKIGKRFNFKCAHPLICAFWNWWLRHGRGLVIPFAFLLPALAMISTIVSCAMSPIPVMFDTAMTLGVTAGLVLFVIEGVLYHAIRFVFFKFYPTLELWKDDYEFFL